MKLINEIKKGIIQAISFLVILGIFGITYAAFNFNDTISEVSSNGTLSSAEYNKLVKKLNMINEKQLATAWVNFDGTDCISDSDSNGYNECSIGGNYNINKVERISQGKYDVYFENNMNNLGYSVISMNSDQDLHTQLTISYLDDSNPQTTSKFRIHFRDSANPTFRDEINMNIQVFGGK